jgi:hypothetical protein
LEKIPIDLQRLIGEFYNEAAARSLLSGMVVAHQTFGDTLRWNPHFHAIVLEGGFDNEGTFFYIPFAGLQPMVEVFRRRVIKLLVERELLNAEFESHRLYRRHKFLRGLCSGIECEVFTRGSGTSCQNGI